MKFAHAFQIHLEQDDFPSEWVSHAISYRALKKCIGRVRAELAELGLDPQILQAPEATGSSDGLAKSHDGGGKSNGAANGTGPGEAAAANVKSVENGEHGAQGRHFRYSLEDRRRRSLDAPTIAPAAASRDGEGGRTTVEFVPKLMFAVDDATGEPLHAALSPETKAYLHRLAQSQQAKQQQQSTPQDTEINAQSALSNDVPSYNSPEASTLTSYPNPFRLNPPSGQRWRMIEVPLTSDAEFFSLLQTELSGLETIQRKEEARFNTEIAALSRAVAEAINPTGSSGVASPSSSSSPSPSSSLADVADNNNGQTTAPIPQSYLQSRSQRSDLKKWRQIFDLYASSDIFFSTTERTRGALPAAEVALRLQKFTDILRKTSGSSSNHHTLHLPSSSLTRFHRPQSTAALLKFLQLQRDLLRSLRFQEINRIAMFKILKKFDKRTALGLNMNNSISSSNKVNNGMLPPSLMKPILTENMAKAICAQISTELLPLVPSLDDYMCPVCFSIAYKPVRLRCGHVFCIRCLVVLQRTAEKHCPMCRAEVVLGATGDDIDVRLKRFLKSTFPDEAKAKQRENERAAGVDMYGEDFYNRKCVVM